MARKRETLDDLLPDGLTAWAARHGINAKSLYSARTGKTRPTTGFLTVLALALDVPVERVRKAAEASRAAKKAAK